jgi:small GTP-binding protein
LADLEQLQKKLPPETRGIMRSVWDALSPSERKNFEDILNAFPNQTNLLRLLLKLSTDQFKQSFGNKQRVAIVGPANVGKSTLYNQLVHRTEDRAEVSPLPGTTRENQIADAGIFSVVDTPGADAVGEVGEREQRLALEAADDADFIIIVFDAIQGIKQTELELYQRLVALAKPYIVVMNKIDLVRKDQTKVIEQAAKHLQLETEQIIPVSARKGENLGQVVAAIAAAEPQIVAALGQALPDYRWQLAWRSIVSAASVSAVIALTPLPVVDFAPLVVTQSVMVLGIARIYNYQITLQRARELVVAFGLGFLGRTLFQQLSKLGGVPGWVLSAAIAASTTVVMGYTATVWFERGERVSNETLRRMTEEMTKYLLQTLRGIGKRRPSRKELQEQIEAALEKTALAEDRTILEEQHFSEPGEEDDPAGTQPK